jgi:hypothetical protein
MNYATPLALAASVTAICLYSTTASASCAAFDATNPVPAVSAGGLIRTALHTGASSSGDGAAIVGLWRAKFSIPNGTVIDDAIVAWHADGTEIMNSARAPITQSFCMGTWVQSGRGSYKLRHFAMSWDNTGTVYVGPAEIRETVSVDANGTHYSGTFTITQYATDERTVLGGVSGTIDAVRLTAN